MGELLTLKDLLENSRIRFSGSLAFQIKRSGSYRKYTFNDVYLLASNLAAYLNSKGVVAGDRVAILSENRPEWPITYLAAASIGAINVPLDAKLTKSEVESLIKESGARLLVISSELQQMHKFTCPAIIIDRIDDIPERTMPEQKISGSDLAAIIYTSGATGSPKGVMLTHWNIMSNVLDVTKLFELGPGDNFLSVLPLHHAFEATAGFMAPFLLGVSITYAESLKSYNLLANMQETKVTVICGVPLLYNLFYQGIMNEVEGKGKAAKKLFEALLAVSGSIPFQPVRRLIFSMIHRKFGGKIRFFVSGGAAIDPDIIRGFELFGITIFQGYGLTESSPILTCNNLSNNRVGSVGMALESVQIKLTDQGEIIAKGPNIMRGYYKRQDLSDEVLKEGWLYTGDTGTIDQDGFVYITGRIKDVIVSGAGVNVYPDEIEFVLNKIPGVGESCILGVKVEAGLKRGMEEVWAVIVPDRNYFKKQKKEDDHRFIEQHIRWEVKRLNAKMTEYKRVANVIIRKNELPKTTTRKVRRFQVRKEECL